MDTPITTSADRRNVRLAAVVNFALSIRQDHGARAAARFLEVHGADFALTVRVLAGPPRRRALDFAPDQR